jgi:hypothetical protein
MVSYTPRKLVRHPDPKTTRRHRHCGAYDPPAYADASSPPPGARRRACHDLRERSEGASAGLHEVASALGRRDEPPQEVTLPFLPAASSRRSLPPPWQYPDGHTTARIEYLGRTARTRSPTKRRETSLAAALREPRSGARPVGGASDVHYKSVRNPTPWEGPFLARGAPSSSTTNARRIGEYLEWKPARAGRGADLARAARARGVGRRALRRADRGLDRSRRASACARLYLRGATGQG